jgi:hypothetical protein
MSDRKLIHQLLDKVLDGLLPKKMDPRRVEPSKVQTQNNLITLSIRDSGGKINDKN